MHLIALIILYLLIAVSPANASCCAAGTSLSSRDYSHLSFRFHYGSVLPHHSSLVYFNNEYVSGFEIKNWFRYADEQAGSTPMIGGGYFFSGLGNREIYGNMHALFFNTKYRLFDRIPVDIDVDVGIAYTTKKFDSEKNYLNRAMGSHLNAYGKFTLSGRIPFGGDRFELMPAISINHLSNGRVVSPNLGLNLLTFSVGLDYRIEKPVRGVINRHRWAPPPGRHRLTMVLAPGIKQVDWRMDKMLFTSSLIFDYGFSITPAFSIGSGVSLFYNETWAYLPFDREEKNRDVEVFQSAAHISLQLRNGPVAFLFHPGIYIYKPTADEATIVNRLGIKYSLSEKITLQIAIKGHWLAVADYIEWGIGYELWL